MSRNFLDFDRTDLKLLVFYVTFHQRVVCIKTIYSNKFHKYNSLAKSEIKYQQFNTSLIKIHQDAGPAGYSNAKFRNGHIFGYNGSKFFFGAYFITKLICFQNISSTHY